MHKIHNLGTMYLYYYFARTTMAPWYNVLCSCTDYLYVRGTSYVVIHIFSLSHPAMHMMVGVRRQSVDEHIVHTYERDIGR